MAEDRQAVSGGVYGMMGLIFTGLSVVFWVFAFLQTPYAPILVGASVSDLAALGAPEEIAVFLLWGLYFSPILFLSGTIFLAASHIAGRFRSTHS